MSERNEIPKEVATVTPSYLTNAAADLGNINQDIDKYKKMPRLQLIQGQTKDRELLAAHGMNSAVIMPGGIKVADLNTSFDFVPLFFWPQWITWSDRKDHQSADMLDASVNPQSEVAKKSQSPDSWEESYGNGFTKRHSEHLNFAVEVYMPGHQLHGQQFVMSFARAEHKTGKSFNTMLSSRRDENGNPVPYIFQVWKASVVERSNDKGSWPGIVFGNPEGEKFIPAEKVDYFKNTFISLRDARDSQVLVVDNMERGDNVRDVDPGDSDSVPF